jgi:hypothetical protein
MNDALVQSILKFTLDARKILERETDEQLQGIYGWLPDGSFTPANKLPAITQLAEAKETRARLERFKDDEATAGIEAKAARKKLLREAAFTWLNRLVAFRMLEERQLIRRSVSRLHGSGAYLSWVTDDKNPEARAQHDAGESPVNPMGEGPRNVAYRRFLLWQCEELSRNESVLFDADTLPSRLFPRPPILKQLVDATNADDLAEAWKAGNEEVLGWTYEGFIEEENSAVFDKFSDGKKVLPDEIAAATQRFTPRWIVRFLVENSLGRIWLEMHPDSRLTASLGYFVPVEKKSSRPLKSVRDIHFLDPSCGSMHFGLVAFDLFVEMYREEVERAGQKGWPAKASVAKLDDIAAAIVRNNLFGIDLDLRAVQIAVLTILIKARTIQPNCAVTDLNFACANMEQIGGGRLDLIVNSAKFKHPIYERVLRGLISRMKNSDHLGSLLRPEKVLQELIAEERRKAEENLKALPGFAPDQFNTPLGVEDFFSNLSEQILQQLDSFVKSSRAAGQDPGHLVAEASKGLRFLRLVSRHYDVVATNPPYMSRRNMSGIMASHLEDEFSEGKGDLYAAFIVRCSELTNSRGKVAMVTQQSFMFISSYEELRANLRLGFGIETMAHLGERAFQNITGAKVNTTAFVFEKRNSVTECDNQTGAYFRLVHEPDADSKRRAFECANVADRKNEASPLLFRYLQKEFDTIPGKPWVYWLSKGILKTFSGNQLLHEIAEPRQGMATAHNARFLRAWWEVGINSVGRHLNTPAAASKSGKKWFPYMKGGAPMPWFGNQWHVVNYLADGRELKAHADPLYGNSGWSRIIKSTDMYFRRGVTWSLIGTSGFAARLSPGGFIFDVAGMTCFPPEEYVAVTLAVLNSRMAKVVLSALNPTVNYQVGDIERLPVPKQRSDKVDALVEDCVKLAKQGSYESELTYDFVEPLRRLDDRHDRKTKLAVLEAEIDSEVSRLYGLTKVDLAVIDRELSATPDAAAEEGENGEGGADDGDDLQTDLSELSWSHAWVSYAIGMVLGRFEIGKANGLGCGSFPTTSVTAIRTLIDQDGIMPSDDGHPQDIASRVVQCLNLMLGAGVARNTIRTATGESGDSVQAMRGWLERFTGSPEKSFWKYHLDRKRYRGRPVYWPLQSPRRQFTVWVFHEKFNTNTLFTIRNMLDERRRLLDRTISDKRAVVGNNRALAKELDKLLEIADDLREFSERIKDIIDRGYTPHIDDGVLLNAAPLHTILPSWPETKEAWEELEAGEYDWAEQAMEYWPDRVKAACKTNKSFAIAHGLA